MAVSIFDFPKQRSSGVGAVMSGQTLVKGQKGFAVAEVQEKLSKLGYSLTVDGLFGPETEAVVKQFQSDVNSATGGRGGIPLRTDGVVDAATWNAIVSRLSSGATKPVLNLPIPQGSATVPTVVANAYPGSAPTAVAPRPTWQTALMVVGAAGLVGVLLYLFVSKDDGLSGYARLLGDDEERVVGSGSTRKCPRVPSTDKLREAEELEAVK